MKSLYESILSSTKSGKAAIFKSFDIKDILRPNTNLRWEKFVNVKEMQKIVKKKLNTSINGLNDGRLFAFYLTTREFNLDEWDIIQKSSSSNRDEVDKIFKEKFKDVLIPEYVKYYTIVFDNPMLYVRVKSGRIPDELGYLIGDPNLVILK